MTYYSFRWLLFLILLVACGYYLLHFFSKLTEINIFSAINWGFRSKVTIGKGFPVWLLSFMAILFYFVLFVGVFSFLETPVHILQMKNHHVGGLLGYKDGSLKTHVYDPSGNRYVAYEHLNPPPAANKFTEAFKVVLFYKDRPSSKYYKDASIFSLSSPLSTLLVVVTGLFAVYIFLYLLAETYISENNLHIPISHHSMATQFSEVTGVTIVKALLITLSVYLFLLIAGIAYVKTLRNHYRGLYKVYQHELRIELLNRVSPTYTITGRVIRRNYNEKARHVSKGFRDSKGNVAGRGGKTDYYYVPVFTIEFKNLLQIPVYINVTTRPSDNAREDEERLVRFFPDEWESIPTEIQELDFTINPDYSISLKRNTDR